MGNAAICGTNLADLGTVAGPQQLLMPASLVLGPHIEERWRSTGASGFLTFDLGAAKTFDAIALFGLVGASTARIRISSADPAGEAGDVLDVVIEQGDGYLDIAYGALSYLLNAPIIARYIRIDLSSADGAYVEAGRCFIGLRAEFTYNFGYGWSYAHVDRSQRQETRGGQTLVQRDNRYRQVDVSFPRITSAQRWSVIEQIDRANGLHTDVLLILDTDSENVARDSIFGLVSDLTPVVQPDPVFDDGGAMFSKQFRITERL